MRGGTAAGIAALAAVVIGGGGVALAQCGRRPLLSRPAVIVDGAGEADPGPPAGDEAAADHTEGFRAFVLADAVREPSWYPKLVRVTFAGRAGELVAETSLPPGWRDATDPRRPAESICGQLYAYAQRGAKLTWTRLVVRASDGAVLVERVGTGGTCRQA